MDKNGDLIGAKDHKYMVWDSQSKKAVPFEEAQKPALSTNGIKNADTTVFDLIAAEAAKWTPQAVEKETSVPAKMVTKLANDYATIKPAMIVQNVGGFQRTQYGGMAVMAQVYLAAFTGNYG